MIRPSNWPIYQQKIQSITTKIKPDVKLREKYCTIDLGKYVLNLLHSWSTLNSRAHQKICLLSFFLTRLSTFHFQNVHNAMPSSLYSSPPQLSYFELGPKKLELSYFLLFPPSYATPLCFRGKKSVTGGKMLKQLSSNFIGLNNAGHLLHKTNSELRYFCSYAILKQHRTFTT